MEYAHTGQKYCFAVLPRDSKSAASVGILSYAACTMLVVNTESYDMVEAQIQNSVFVITSIGSSHDLNSQRMRDDFMASSSFSTPFLLQSQSLKLS